MALCQCLIIVQIPLLIFPAAVIWGTVLMVMSYRVSVLPSMLLAAVSLLFISIFTGFTPSFLYSATLLVPMAFMAWWMPRKSTAGDARAGAMIAVVLSVTLFLGLAFNNVGLQGIDQLEQEANNLLIKSVYSPENAFLMELYKIQGISVSQVQQDFAEILHWVVRLIPALFMVRSFAAVIFTQIIAGWWNRRQGLAGPPELVFSREMMPGPAAWAVIVGLAMWLMDWKTQGLWYYAGANILFFFLWVTAYYGLAVFVYWRQHSEQPLNPWLVLIVIVTMLIAPHFYVVLAAMVGLFDALLDYRELESKKEEIL